MRSVFYALGVHFLSAIKFDDVSDKELEKMRAEQVELSQMIDSRNLDVIPGARESAINQYNYMESVISEIEQQRETDDDYLKPAPARLVIGMNKKQNEIIDLIQNARRTKPNEIVQRFVKKQKQKATNRLSPAKEFDFVDNIFWALQKNNPALLSQALSSASSRVLRERTDFLEHSLFKAVETGKQELVFEFLIRGVNPSATRGERDNIDPNVAAESILHLTKPFTSISNHHIFPLLLAAGANPNKPRYNDNLTPLARHFNMDSKTIYLKMLLDAGANIDIPINTEYTKSLEKLPHDSEWTPLQCAIHGLKSEPDTDLHLERDPLNQETFVKNMKLIFDTHQLITRCRAGQRLHEFKSLIDQGASVTAVNEEGKSALYYILESYANGDRDEEAADYLLDVMSERYVSSHVKSNFDKLVERGSDDFVDILFERMLTPLRECDSFHAFKINLIILTKKLFPSSDFRKRDRLALKSMGLSRCTDGICSDVIEGRLYAKVGRFLQKHLGLLEFDGFEGRILREYVEMDLYTFLYEMKNLDWKRVMTMYDPTTYDEFMNMKLTSV